MGVTVFSLGVGKKYDVIQLNSMATDPDHDHVFRSSDFSHLSWWLSEKIKDKVCDSKFKSILIQVVIKLLDIPTLNYNVPTTCNRLSVDLHNYFGAKFRVIHYGCLNQGRKTH